MRARFKIETERDRAILLITGGALTVSFAYLPTLSDKGPVVRIGSLILAWVAWGLTLVWMLVNYSISIGVYGEQIGKLSEGKWEEARTEPWLARHIEKFNNLTVGLMVMGFVFFGNFAIGNLDRLSLSNGQQKEVSAASRLGGRTKGSATIRKEISPRTKEPKEGAPSQRELSPATAGELPSPAKEKAAVP